MDVYAPIRPVRTRRCPAAVSTLLVVAILGLLGLWIVLKVVMVGFEDGSEWVAAASAVSLPFGLMLLGFPVTALVSSVVGVVSIATGRLERDGGHLVVTSKPWPPGVPLPPVTVWVPVFTEDFASVIRPTLLSALAAADAYPGPASVVVSDDGLAVLSDRSDHAAARLRREFYRAHGIGFVARPRARRAGRFPKASNMNHTLKVDLAVRATGAAGSAERAAAARRLLGRGEFPGTEVGGDPSLGEYLLLLDKDSRVPADVLGAVIGEFAHDPRVAVLQLAITPLNRDDTVFSGLVSHHTVSLYSQALPVVAANGCQSPFVGHNAVLRRAALEDVAAVSDRWWDEVVSEDLALALRLQVAGWDLAYVRIPGLVTHEGVTLTYEAERDKIAKFAFGAVEIVLRPVRHWGHGPLNPIFAGFLRARAVTWHAKVGLIFYLGSFAALGLAPLVLPSIVVAEAVVGVGWGQVYVSSVVISISCFVIFGMVGTAAEVVTRRVATAKALMPAGERLSLAAHAMIVARTTLYYSSLPTAISMSIVAYLAGSERRFGSTPMEGPELVSRPAALAAIIRANGLQCATSSITVLLVAVVVWTPGHFDAPVHVVGGPLLMALAQVAAPIVFHPSFSFSQGPAPETVGRTRHSPARVGRCGEPVCLSATAARVGAGRASRRPVTSPVRAPGRGRRARAGRS